MEPGMPPGFWRLSGKGLYVDVCSLVGLVGPVVNNPPKALCDVLGNKRWGFHTLARIVEINLRIHISRIVWSFVANSGAVEMPARLGKRFARSQLSLCIFVPGAITFAVVQLRPNGSGVFLGQLFDSGFHELYLSEKFL